MRGVQADDLERVFGGSRGADAPMGLGGTGTPKRSWPKQARRKRITLTSRHFLSPLDTGPSRRLPEGLRGGTALGPRAASRRGASRPDASRKGAVCGLRVAQNALFRYITAREAWGTTPPPACGALWKMTQLGKRARTTPRQAAGGVAQCH